MSAVAMPTRLRPRHWSLALGGALLLHAALALVFHQLVQGGTVAPGRGGVEVGLPPAGAATAQAAPDVAEVIEAAPLSPPAPAAAAPPTAEPLYAPVETVQAVDPSQEPETAEVEAAEPVDEAIAESVMAMRPRAKPRPPVAEKPVQPEVADAEPAEMTPAEMAPAEMAPARMAAVATGAEEGPPADDEMIGSDGKAGTGERAATGAAEGQSGGGAAGAFVDYKAQLLAWLERHKEYPRRARLRRQQGTAVLHFVMDRSGRVLEYSIKASSGYRLLDEEVAAMIQRASPLPVPPPALAGDRLGYTVPVEFSQR